MTGLRGDLVTQQRVLFAAATAGVVLLVSALLVGTRSVGGASSSDSYAE